MSKLSHEQELGMAAAQVQASPETTQRPPWYSLDPRTLKRSNFLRAVLIGLLLMSFSFAPLWRLLWYFPVYGFQDFIPVRDAHGQQRKAWQWIDGKEIRLYAAPGVNAARTAEIAEGMRALLREVGLDFAVKEMPMPPKVAAAYRASLMKKQVAGGTVTYVSFDKLTANLVVLRDGDPHADALIVDVPLYECDWAHGMAMFNKGLAIFEEESVDFHLGKHETGHLMGYMYHDSYPLYVIGYPWEGTPWGRDTLMMIYGRENTLSPRARDALRYFWRGMERRSGKKFLKT